MAGTAEPDLQQFLKKVDDLESIIKGLNSEDEDVRKKSIAEADRVMATDKKMEDQKKKKWPAQDNTGVNRTVINQKAFDEPVYDQPPINSNVSQDSFMNMMEKDIQSRSERRKKNSAEATRLKELGNEQFKGGNYEQAVKLYSQALAVFKDNTVLWTNRAQAYIKLGEYEKALEDCDWALRVYENCLKAYIHQGKAYLGLKQYDNAIESFHKAIQVEPKKEKAIQEYITEVERARRADEQEGDARTLFEGGNEGAKGLVDLWTRVNKEEQLPLYYSGGLRVIKELLVNTNDKTLFRTSGGLQVTETHPVISKCFSAKPRSLSRDQLDMCTATLEVLRTACASNEENCRRLLEVASLPAQLLTYLATPHKSCRPLRQAALTLLHTISQEEAGREKLCKLDLTSLCGSLFSLLEVSAVCAYSAVGLLNNLALDKKFKVELRDNIEEAILPAFEKLLTEGCNQPSVLPTCITTVTNLSGDAHIRKKLVHRLPLWEALTQALREYLKRINQPEPSEIVREILGLLMNLTLDPCDNCDKFVTTMCTSCVQLLKGGEQSQEERSLGLLSHLLPRCTKAVDHVCSKDAAEHLVEILKMDKELTRKACLKCLTACTAHNESAKQAVIQNKGLSALVGLLKIPDEIVFGNAALCLSHLVTEPRVCDKLTKTNIVQHLLVLARDGHDRQVQHNCSILLAKLAQGNVKHLERLRELHGIEILFDVMKYVKE